MKFILKLRISKVALGSGHVCGLLALSQFDTIERIIVNIASARTSVRQWLLTIGDHYVRPMVCHSDGNYCDIWGCENHSDQYQ